jgi:hypothetical protein
MRVFRLSTVFCAYKNVAINRNAQLLRSDKLRFYNFFDIPPPRSMVCPIPLNFHELHDCMNNRI